MYVCMHDVCMCVCMSVTEWTDCLATNLNRNTHTPKRQRCIVLHTYLQTDAERRRGRNETTVRVKFLLRSLSKIYVRGKRTFTGRIFLLPVAESMIDYGSTSFIRTEIKEIENHLKCLTASEAEAIMDQSSKGVRL